MLSLSDVQLAIVVEAAGALDPERRDVFLERCAAMLKLRGRFSDADVSDVVQLAAHGLAQQRHSAA